MSADHPQLEAELRRRFDLGDLDGMLAAAIQGYGPELFGFVYGLCRDAARADDVFGAMCERMWRGLPRFQWKSTFRVWAYAIARNEFLRSTRSTVRARREIPVSQIASVQAIANVRSTTPIHQRTDVHDRFAKVRAQLEPEDHMLLGLRLDRQLAWTDIAQILAGESELAGEALRREAAALRKRFERLKVRLRELIEAAD